MSAAYRIKQAVDVHTARAAARRLAVQSGFGRIAAEEMCIVVSELATNILKYGRRGEVLLETFPDPAREVGLRVVARDEGPPFKNLERALADGCDDEGPIDPARFWGRSGIGGGLGAVVRLTDSFECVPEPGGKRIVVTRFLRRGKR